ncbi:MAG: ferredoxin/flavodoxin---NADP+ reductase [Mycobacterium sp.]|nr:ferredoxin/flavodoxin---NADP+ reductase [Mycobacterium sp.]
MAYVITQNCCKDASCVPVCPVDCIRPVGGAGDLSGTQMSTAQNSTATMLYIDPESCIDCGACLDECPVGAIHYDEDLPPHLERFKAMNAAYFERHPLEPDATSARSSRAAVAHGSLRVAIVGAGPAACYAAAELIDVDGVEVDLFERLPTPFGLIRAGVAPDHVHTKSVTNLFDHVFTSKRFGCHLNVEVGRDVTHDDLLAHHHAVIYAFGAATSRTLGIPGEELPGSHAASDFVGWYNGHPDHAARSFDLGASRAVIVGNGNVALDVARVLLMGSDGLADTDAAEHALDALRDGAVDEVVILGRRGLRDAAFSVGEFLALGHLDGVDVVIEPGDVPDGDDTDVETSFKLEVASEYAHRAPTPGNKRIVFRFNATPAEVIGVERAEGVRLDGGEVIDAALILRSIGYRGAPMPGLAYDDANGVIPNDHGRVLDGSGLPVPGVYVTGWIKRGPRGVIGTNRACAEETVAALWDDLAAGLLDRVVDDRDALQALLTARGARPIPWRGWRAIDEAERARGTAASRPRVKFVAVAEMLSAAQPQSVPT